MSTNNIKNNGLVHEKHEKHEKDSPVGWDAIPASGSRARVQARNGKKAGIASQPARFRAQ